MVWKRKPACSALSRQSGRSSHAIRCISRSHVPECPPDIECPVEPKPPREVEDPEFVDMMPVPLRPPEVGAVETEVGVRPAEKKPCRLDDEPEFQLQLPPDR